eukprot:gb/GECG01006530.1/.p1 GENE.gb/GECG01006530.1/~~gb/GECG01006530.1/.p1  ORF type:complete len:261 (+),score=47.29 gb/GECG01006530.1/:1-783(+)
MAEQSTSNMFSMLRDMDYEDDTDQTDGEEQYEVNLKDASFDANAVAAKLREEIQRSNKVTQRLQQFNQTLRSSRSDTAAAASSSASESEQHQSKGFRGATDALNSVIDDILQGNNASRYGESYGGQKPSTKANSQQEATDGLSFDLRTVLSHVESKNLLSSDRKGGSGSSATWDFSGLTAVAETEGQKAQRELAEKIARLHEKDEKQNELFGKVKGKNKKTKSKAMRADDINCRVQKRVRRSIHTFLKMSCIYEVCIYVL